MLKHTDTKGLNTQYRYNAAGLLEQCIDANRHQIGYQWDNQGRIQKLTNQNHAEYLFSYNRFGQLVHEQAFDGEEKNYSYNENGQLFQIRQPNVFTQFAYFADGMIASKTYTHVQTRVSQTEEFEYNLNHQLSKARNKDSQIDFYRNPLGQLVREHQHYNVPNLKPMTAVLRYEYDELGNLTKTIRPDGQVQTNLNYGSGHIYGIAFNQQDMVAFQRDDLHRETARMLANGLVQTKNYNDVGLLSSQLIQPEQETLGRVQHQAERQYHYDQNYLLSQVDDSRLGKLNYQYDAVGRLIQSQSVHKTESFTFDPAGNLIDPIATQASQVKSNLIAQYQGKNYKYDAQGNVIESSHAGKTLKLTWDNLNRLIQSELNGQATEYGYDVFGRRLYKKNQNAQTLTLFGWDGDLMIWESQQSNAVEENYTKHYVYEPQSFVPLLQTGYTGFIKLIETPDYSRFQTEPYSIYKDPVWKVETRKNKAELERVMFYHCDQVGTPQTLSNELGECVWEIKQDTWGTSLEIKASENSLEQTNIRFQGQYYDGETGLHYNRYRYYEPHSARYVSKDPIGLAGGLNNLAYVSDPNQWVDPMGLMGGKDNGLFWLTDSASEESNNQIKNMVQQSRNNPNNKTQLELIQSDAEKGRVLRANTPAVSPTESQRNDFPVINNSRGSSNGGVLAKLLPNTMSPLAKDPQLAQDLKAQGAMRNNNLGAVAVAGYAPYAIVGGKEAAPVVLKVGREGIKSIPSLSKTALQNAKNISATPVGQAVVKTTGGSVLVDSSLQAKDMYKCKCLQRDGSRSLVAVGTGAAFGAWGGDGTNS